VSQERMNHKRLARKYPPSESCECEICRQYCRRPGWWTVDEATRAMNAGLASRMMLEVSPEFTFGVLSPAFRGSEGSVALNLHAHKGCNFLRDNRCELHGTGFQPLECRFCHHDRVGLGPLCHADIEKDWNTKAGKALVVRWANALGYGTIPVPALIPR